MVTILTPLRGSSALSLRWHTFAARAITDGHRVIATVHTEADKDLVEGLGPAAKAIVVAKFLPDDEVQRINFVADLYNKMMVEVESDLVVLLDDDVLPPSKGVSVLEKNLASKPDAAGIVSIYPFKDLEISHQAVLFWKPFESLAANMSTVPTKGLHKVWGGGTGFSIWRTSILKKTLPWTTRSIRGFIPGWDWDLAAKLYKLELETFVDAGLRCRHDDLPS